MTIEQERDIAVRALERIISDYKNAYLGHLDAKNVAEEAIVAISAQASPAGPFCKVCMGSGDEQGAAGHPCWKCDGTGTPLDETATQASLVAQDDIDQRTERIRLSHANADSKGKIQLRHEVECLLAHICLLKAGRASVEVPAAPIAWTYGPNEFKDWCSQYFGPDSDEEYLAKAAFDLPPMAQQFARPAAQPVGEAVPDLIVKAIQHYGDARADADLKSGPFLAQAITAIRQHYTAPPVAQDQDAVLRAVLAEVTEKLDRTSAELLGLRNPSQGEKRRSGTLYEAMNRAATNLPEQYTIMIELEIGYGGVSWSGPDCEWKHINGEGWLCDDLNEAIDAAMQAEVKS